MRNVLLRPDAMPLRQADDAETDARDGGIGNADAQAGEQHPGMRTVQPELGPTASNAAMPAADMAIRHRARRQAEVC